MFRIKSTFPELDKCQASFKRVVQTESTIVGCLQAAATPAFNSYADRQPAEMKEGLKTIKETYTEQSLYQANVLKEIQSVNNEFEQLRIHHNGIMPQRTAKGVPYEKHEVAKYNLDIAKKEVARLKHTNASEGQIDNAVKNLETAENEERETNNYDKNYETKFLTYEKRFAETISRPLERLSKTWAESSRKIAEIAGKIEQSTEGFQEDKSDKTIEKLKKIIENIDEQLSHIEESNNPNADNEENAANRNDQRFSSVKFLVQEDGSDDVIA